MQPAPIASGGPPPALFPYFDRLKDRLGISHSTAHRLAKSRAILPIKIGKRVLVEDAAIDRFIADAKTRSAAGEIAR